MNAETAALTRRAALASVSAALFLGALKGYAAWATGSVAMLGSLADSLLDLVASLVTLFGVHVAAQPADEEHRFGHGKAEALAALFQVTVITVSAFGILTRAIMRFAEGAVTTQVEDGIIVSLIAIAVTLALTAYQRHVVRKTQSLAIGTDKVHYESDLALNLAVIIALALERYAGLTGADPAFGVAIALWLLFGAFRASYAAVNQLMDREWPEEKRRSFVEAVGRHPEIRGMHDLRTRTSGAHDFAQFHMALDPQMSVQRAHDIVERVEHDLIAQFPGTEILIHIDPDGHSDAALAGVDELERLKDGQGERD